MIGTLPPNLPDLIETKAEHKLECLNFDYKVKWKNQKWVVKKI